MLFRLSIPALAAALALSHPVLAEEHAGFIDKDAARQLAYEAVGRSLPHADLFDLPDGDGPPFFLFEEHDISRSRGHYAVNPWTGDVWSMAGRCRLLTSHALRRMQAEIRKKYRRQAGGNWVVWKRMKPRCNAK